MTPDRSTHVTTVVVGAGHAGLAMSHRLTSRSIDHVVIERGEVGEAWRQRRPTLRLLTPNALTRLPGLDDAVADPDGFMTAPAVAELVRSYARRIAAPVHTGTTVGRVSAIPGGDPTRRYAVATDRGTWTCATVVLAGGSHSAAVVPAIAAGLPAGVVSMTADAYRDARLLDERGVLVVGASASGVQLADEIRRSGREVTLAVGEHVRLPRRYRGRDIFWWLDASGVLDQRHDEVDDLVRARHVPSPQLVGSADGRSVDLNALADLGVRLVGRLVGVQDGTFRFSGGLTNVCSLADLKARRLLAALDDWASVTAPDAAAPERLEPTRVPVRPALELPIGGFGTVIWATGYRPDHAWLDLPVLDRSGHIRHEGGVVTGAPGAYLLGGNLLRRRRSSYISGAAADSHDLAEHLHHHLDRHCARPTVRPAVVTAPP